jgi:hypothetical protein
MVLRTRGANPSFREGELRGDLALERRQARGLRLQPLSIHVACSPSPFKLDRLEVWMKMLIGAAALVLALGVPAAAAAQQAPAQPSPFKALEVADELQLTPDQRAAVTVARDSLREAHRIHCGPMHASTPSEADEARHHAEMALINARWEGQARAAMTPVQLTRLAELRPVQPAAAEHGDHHGAAPAAQGHGGHQGHGAQQPAAAGHGGHGHGGQHPAPQQPAPTATPPAQNHSGHPSR